MSQYTFSPQAYFKVIFHSAKYPHLPVNGVLLGRDEGGKVTIDDAIPLLHHWTSLSPMMEIGLDLAGRHAEAAGLSLVGYYQACERIDDTSLAPVGEKVAGKLKDGFKNAIAFVVDGEKLGSGDPALLAYLPQGTSTSWRPATVNIQFASQDIPQRALTLVREEWRHEAFGDFDDHLENVEIDWLRNSACMPSDI
ncbi:MPN domain-containing protein [Mycena kentingensis (nom. inval.)]|nr:MPN domain-containing protein [Mycena kentingensis (nom. inval.)]